MGVAYVANQTWYSSLVGGCDVTATCNLLWYLASQAEECGNLFDEKGNIRTLSFYLELSSKHRMEGGSKIGGKPYFIGGAQAGLLRSELEEKILDFC